MLVWRKFLQRRLEGAVSLRLEILPRAGQKLLLPLDDPPENDAIVPKRPAARSSGLNRPSFTKSSGLIKSGLPAKAEKH